MNMSILPTKTFRSILTIIFLLAMVTNTCLNSEQVTKTILNAELESLIAGLSPNQQKTIKSQSGLFLELLKKVSTQDQWLTILVDKKHALSADYEPEDLVSLDTVVPKLALNSSGQRLRKILIADLQEMSAAARKLGISLDISSAYRSYAYQKKVFARWVREDGQVQAERESAHAGASQHQLGLAMDFGSITPAFGKTQAGIWLLKHAPEFGFSLSYPLGQEEFTGYMPEPWHYRYIGRAAAQLQETFFAGSQQSLLIFLHDQAQPISALFQKPAQ